MHLQESPHNGRCIISLGNTRFRFGIFITNSVAIITDATPKDDLGLSLGINQIAFRFGAMAGLTFSGVILSVLDWRALFYVNIWNIAVS
ncbi:MAG: MFS transporter [Candidatus Bathyarchaeia archaeon]